MPKHHPFMIALLIILTLLALTGSAAQAFSQQQVTDQYAKNSSRSSDIQGQPPAARVVRVYYTGQDDLNSLASRLDVWEVNQNEGYLVAMVTPQEQQELIQAGYRVEVDEKLTQQVNTPREIDPNQLNGIPGYSCYRTVEETQASMDSLIANYPSLVQKINIGSSWDKATPNGPTGYDLWALKITNQSIPGPKPVFFLMAEIHAREYVTAETAIRFAEYLVSNYGVDPDITWLLDYYEIHIVPLTNPDGRKLAEGGTLWRKNTDNDDGCSNPSQWGTDLNRNSSFKWVGSGSSTNPCSETYRGPLAASEPETLAIQTYVNGIFRDQRGPGDTDAAPANTTGEFITLHSYSPLVLWPWGWTSTAAPNGTQLQTLGRKLAYFNNYPPEQSDSLYATNGTTDDWAYGVYGVAAYTFEMGTGFFQDCSSFESTIYPTNLNSLLYAFKAARLPYMEPAGPEALNVTVTPGGVAVGQSVQLTAVINDQRYNNSNGTEPTQNIKTAAYTIDTPPWITGAITHTMSAVDGAWNHLKVENVTANVDTTGLSRGRHTIFVRGQDAIDNWGVVSAVYLYVVDPAVDPTIQGYVRDGANNTALSANLTAGSFNATTDPSTGFYSMVVISDTYALNAVSAGHAVVSVSNVQAQDYQTVRQDIYLYPICTVFSDNVESGNLGWTPDSSSWGITTARSHSSTHSWTDSPGGNYGNNWNKSITSPAFALSTYSGINLSIWHWYSTEANYDYAYIEYSPTGNTPWTTIASYTGADTTWKQVNLAIPGLDNQPGGKIRFRLQSDQYLTNDGWYIDDLLLSGGGPACVTNPLAPTAEFTSTSPVNLGTALQFDDLTTGTPPFTYSWDFGDGIGHSSDSHPAYTYASTGAFTVTLTLTNTLGSDNASHLVEVEPFVPPVKVFLPVIMTKLAAHTQVPVRTLPPALWVVIPVVGLTIRKYHRRKK